MGYWEDVQNAARTGRSTANTGTGGRDRRREIAASYNAPRINDTPDRPYTGVGALGTADAHERFVTGGGGGGGGGAQPLALGRPRGGGGYGWGGGGGGAMSAAMQAGLKDLINSRLLQVDPAAFDSDKARVGKAAEADRASMAGAFADMMTRLEGTNSPWGYEVGGGGEVSPVQADYLASQGVDPRRYMADVDAVNAQARENAAGFRNMNQALGAAFQEAMNSRMHETRQAEQYGNQAIDAEVRGMNQLIEERMRNEKKEKEALMIQLLQQYIGAGGKDIASLIGGLG